MIELPDSATFAATFADPRTYAAMAVSILAGAVRGFSGFGSALIFVPLMSAIYDPRTAAGTFLLIDFAVALAVLPTVGREAHWRDVFPLATAAVIAAQFGALILIYTDAITLRWGIAIVVLILLAVLMSGWRYHGRPKLPVTLAVGGLAGTLGGAIQIVGPPVIVYWLGSSWSPAIVRANLNAFFGVFAMRAVRDLYRARAPACARVRAGAAARAAPGARADDRHAAVPRRLRADLPARRLRDRRRGGAGQHADLGWADPLGGHSQALILATSASDTSKLA